MHAISLNNVALLKISGADSAHFLQGQLTNDVELLKDNWHYSGYCNPKGRLLGLFKIWRREDDFYALLDASLVDSVVSRLRMFVMRSKVSIDQLSDANAFGILSAAETLMLASGESLTVSAQSRGNMTFEHGLFVLDIGTRSIIIDPDGTKVDSEVGVDNEAEWGFLDIDAGLPSLQAETAEMFIPQLLNLDLLHGVNFKKGCYTGQEIVARMHYLGKLKQRMFLCDVSGAQGNETPGAKIVSSEGKNAGNLVTPIIKGKCLAALRTEYLDAELQIEGASDMALKSAAKQPYPIAVA